MKMSRYEIVSKENHKVMYARWTKAECESLLATLENRDQYFIRFKFMSV